MTVSLPLLVAMAVLYATGVYLLLEKSMTRVIIGVILVGNATNLLLLVVSGPPGDAPLVDDEATSYADSLPQALTLTAIVITFAVSAFLMALVYRSWKLAREDELSVDEEDVSLSSRDRPTAETVEAQGDSDFGPDADAAVPGAVDPGTRRREEEDR